MIIAKNLQSVYKNNKEELLKLVAKDQNKPMGFDELEYSFVDLQDKKMEEIESWKERKLNYEFYLKPIILCVYCMPSFWGTIIYVSLNGFTNPIEWILSCVMSVFINAFIWDLYTKLN